MNEAVPEVNDPAEPALWAGLLYDPLKVGPYLSLDLFARPGARQGCKGPPCRVQISPQDTCPQGCDPYNATQGKTPRDAWRGRYTRR